MNERDIKKEVEPILSRHFRLTPEVWLQHPLDDKKLRIDYLAFPRMEFPVPFVGIEVKTGEGDGFKTLTKALAQCVDYYHSSIIDQRHPKLVGSRIPTLHLLDRSLWHVYRSTLELDNDRNRFGAIRLAGKFKIGYCVHTRYNGLALTVGPDRLWSEHDGLRAGAMNGWNQVKKVGNRG